MKEKQDVVLKLGGSLIDCASALIRKIGDRKWSVLIVPGGAVFADTIRSFCGGYAVSDEASHWMAVLAMEQYGYYLADLTGTALTDDPDRTDRVNVLLPYKLLKHDDIGLPHSWDVTSDTIAAWVAHRTGRRLIKATDVDGIYLEGGLAPGIYAGDLVGKETCVDAGLPAFLVEHDIDCMVVNGKYPQRVLSAMEGDTGVGTFISGRASIKSV